ncbi:MAG: DUF898 family protein [Rhodobacteraceae bacterium]|nr:DUF898 family protein [Paracoccaceae bacterium]
MNMNDSLPAAYFGKKGALFALALKTSLLTIVTLGIYRFWAKTRIRKYVWSSITVGEDALEYTGTGLEKFLGFLVAVVILAIYLGFVQLGLFFLGLHFIAEPQNQREALQQIAVFYISLFAVAPLIVFARYRARRYILARTRFRGIRFGMDKAAWGYVWRAIVHSLVTLLTLGLLLPRQTFNLEKYLTDHSHFGDQSFVQGGKWTALYPAVKHILFGAGLVLLSVVVSIAANALAGPGDRFSAGVIAAIVAAIGGYCWIIFGYVYYSVHSFRYLTAHKLLAGTVGFVALPRTGKVIGIYVTGLLIISVVAGFIFGVIGGVTAVFPMSISVSTAGYIVIAVLYLGALAMLGALSLVFITQPMIAHFVDTLAVRNPAGLDSVRQRAYDKGADAGGFADALDVGAAI